MSVNAIIPEPKNRNWHNPNVFASHPAQRESTHRALNTILKTPHNVDRTVLSRQQQHILSCRHRFLAIAWDFDFMHSSLFVPFKLSSQPAAIDVASPRYRLVVKTSHSQQICSTPTKGKSEPLASIGAEVSCKPWIYLSCESCTSDERKRGDTIANRTQKVSTMRYKLHILHILTLNFEQTNATGFLEDLFRRWSHAAWIRFPSVACVLSAFGICVGSVSNLVSGRWYVSFNSVESLDFSYFCVCAAQQLEFCWRVRALFVVVLSECVDVPIAYIILASRFLSFVFGFPRQLVSLYRWYLQKRPGWL